MFRLLFLILLFSLLLGCGENSSTVDDTAPSTPTMIPRSMDDVYPQQGVRAEPISIDRNHWVRIEWLRGPEEDIAGYRIYRTYEWDTTSNGQLRAPSLVADLNLILLPDVDTLYWVDGQSNDALAPDPLLGNSRGFYWQVQAYDNAADANFSALSSRVYYRLIENPFNLAATRVGNNTYSLSWNFPSSAVLDLSYYKIRIYSQFWGRDSVYWNPPIEQRYGTSENITISMSDLQQPLIQDCTYVWQLNAVSVIHSESHREALAGSCAKISFTYQN